MLTYFQKWHKESGYIILIFIFNSQLLKAQPMTLLAEMELNHGLRHNSVRTIIQDSLKRTYLGTESGLIILNSNDSFLDTIAQCNEKLAIVSMNIVDNMLFIGSISNGLKIYDLKNKIEIHSPFMDSIRYVRHIRKIGNEVFIAANSSSWRIKIINSKLFFQKIHRPFSSGFFTDFYYTKNKIFGFDIRSSYAQSRIYEIIDKRAVPINFPSGFPQNPVLIFLTAINNDSVTITAGDGFYHLANKNGTTSFKLLKDSSQKINLPVWDIAITKNKYFLAIGQQYLLTAGLTYDINTNSTSDLRNDFFCQSLTYDKKHDALWIGTYNRGLFIWPNISTSTKLPINLSGNYKIIAGQKGEYYIGNEEDIYHLNSITNELKIISNNQYDKTKNSIRDIEYKNDTLSVFSTNSLTFFNKNGKELRKYPFSIYQFVHHRKKGDSIYFFTQYNTGIFVQHKNDKERKVLQGISISPKSREYKKGFIFFSDEKGFYYYDTIIHQLNSPLTKIEDFIIIGNQIWTLNAGLINIFEISVENKILIPKAEVSISNKLEGFVPNWIKKWNDNVYIGNNKGIIKLNSHNGTPQWYRYLGNYTSNSNPTIIEDTLVMIQDNYIEKVKLIQPYEINDLNGFTLSLNRKDGLFERFPIDIEANHTDYFLNNYSLKRIEIKDEEGTIKSYFTLSNKISFPSGLIKGKYEVSLYVNDYFVNKINFRISIPLLENPIFYIVLASIAIILFYLFFRFRNNKQKLERNMLENRLQLLKKNLDPHFIFNSLNLTYMLLLQEKNKEAIDSITQFSELHRYFLETINKNQVSLSEELNFIKNYLELEKKKTFIDEPFSYFITPHENEFSDFFIPPMILHPLVENAVKYCGFDSNHSDQGLIRVDVTMAESFVLISIENTIGPKDLSSNIGFKKGVEIVQESINIYKKMGLHHLKFKESVSPIHFHPGFRCEVLLFLS